MSPGLRKRIRTAAVLVAALLIVLLWLRPAAIIGLITLLLLAGAWEWAGFAGFSRAGPRLAYVAVIALSLWVAWRGFSGSRLPALLTAAVAWWCIALLWVVFAPRRMSGTAAALAGVLALVPSWLALVHLRLASPRGAQWLLFTLLLVWVADIGAFFAGRWLGRVRLAPQVSPGKTWEGVAGALLATALLAVAGGRWFAAPRVPFVLLCLTAVGFSIVGDLTESMLKRFAGVKDSGSVFPGHGGVMDRIDSVTGAAPVLVLGLTQLGVLP